MGERTLEARVENLENLATILTPLPQEVGRLGDRLDGVESRLTTVESQIVQLRTEMGDGFSAIRNELAEHARETAGHFLEVQGQAAETQRQVIETQRQMRVLHEDVVGRLTLLGETSPRSKKKR